MNIYIFNVVIHFSNNLENKIVLCVNKTCFTVLTLWMNNKETKFKFSRISTFVLYIL